MYFPVGELRRSNSDQHGQPQPELRGKQEMVKVIWWLSKDLFVDFWWISIDSKNLMNSWQVGYWTPLAVGWDVSLQRDHLSQCNVAFASLENPTIIFTFLFLENITITLTFIYLDKCNHHFHFYIPWRKKL